MGWISAFWSDEIFNAIAFFALKYVGRESQTIQFYEAHLLKLERDDESHSKSMHIRPFNEWNRFYPFAASYFLLTCSSSPTMTGWINYVR